MDVYLETERLRLRRFTAADVELLVELDSDPEVMRFLTGQPTPREEIENVVLPGILKVYDEHPEPGHVRRRAEVRRRVHRVVRAAADRRRQRPWASGTG